MDIVPKNNYRYPDCILSAILVCDCSFRVIHVCVKELLFSKRSSKEVDILVQIGR